MVLTDIEGKNERILATRRSENGFTNGGVSWSPDGKLIAVAGFHEVLLHDAARAAELRGA